MFLAAHAVLHELIRVWLVRFGYRGSYFFVSHVGGEAPDENIVESLSLICVNIFIHYHLIQWDK